MFARRRRRRQRTRRLAYGAEKEKRDTKIIDLAIVWSLNVAQGPNSKYYGWISCRQKERVLRQLSCNYLHATAAAVSRANLFKRSPELAMCDSH